MKIYTIGHMSPDLDTVASAVVYAQLLIHLDTYKGVDIIPLTTDSVNAETAFVFEKFGLPLPAKLEDIDIQPEDKFILVDHNEDTQRHKAIPNDSVVEIIDHHKININFTTPIKIDVRPLGSTCSILYLLFKTHVLAMDKPLQGLVLAAILSDTVGLKSPTTTGLDSTIAHEMASDLGISIVEFTFDIFKAKSNLGDLSIEEIINKDFKIFDFGGRKVFIGQVETVDQASVLSQKDALVDGLNNLKAKVGCSHAYLCITDILNINTKVVFETLEEGSVLEQAFTTSATDHVADIGPKLSRKKEISPAIERIMTDN
ncbi:MAG: hypothetical protein RLY61_725 [Candidatus Parcubacteria bacterium]